LSASSGPIRAMPRPTLCGLRLPQRRPGGLGTGNPGHRPDRTTCWPTTPPRPAPRAATPAPTSPSTTDTKTATCPQARPANPGHHARNAPAAAVATFSTTDCGLPRPPPLHHSKQETKTTHRPAPRPGPSPSRRPHRGHDDPFQDRLRPPRRRRSTMNQATSHGARLRTLPRPTQDPPRALYMATALNLLRLQASGPAPHFRRQRTSHLHDSNSSPAA